MVTTYKATGRALGNHLVARMGRLLGIFLAAAAYFVAVAHLTNLYAAEHQAVEKFILFSGNVYTWLFWVGFGLVGTLLPMLLVFSNVRRTITPVVWASVLTLLGGFALMYVIIIGGQAFPLVLFPGKEASSSFFDGQVAAYAPSMPEVLLGIGGVALAVAITLFATRVLPILPRSLADEDVDPHMAREAEVVELKKAA
jgi:molybdopterin-containing oxidoreductase family membrane subunit